MAWVFLVCAGLLEVYAALDCFWSSFLKLSEGFTKLGYSAVTIAGMLASFYLLSQAMKTLPPGHGLRRLDRHRRPGLRGGGHFDLPGAGDRRPPVLHGAAAGGDHRHQADLPATEGKRERGLDTVQSPFAVTDPPR